jgi:hypothetical protein
MIRRPLFGSRNRGFGGSQLGSGFSSAERDRFYFRRRLGLAGGFVLVEFAGLFARFLYWQVM